MFEIIFATIFQMHDQRCCSQGSRARWLHRWVSLPLAYHRSSLLRLVWNQGGNRCDAHHHKSFYLCQENFSSMKPWRPKFISRPDDLWYWGFNEENQWFGVERILHLIRIYNLRKPEVVKITCNSCALVLKEFMFFGLLSMAQTFVSSLSVCYNS